MKITRILRRRVERQGLHERRRCMRYLVDWTAVLMKKEGGGELFHDRIHDVSLCGASFFAEADIYTEQPLVLLLETPQAFGRTEKNIAGIECVMCQPVYVPEEGKYRVELRFVRFYGIAKHLLADILISQERKVVLQ
jgi:hypothetical protein